MTTEKHFYNNAGKEVKEGDPSATQAEILTKDGETVVEREWYYTEDYKPAKTLPLSGLAEKLKE